jgi:hypothetical protein
MRRARIIFALIVAALALVALARWRAHASPPQFAGRWKSWRSEFRISKQGDHYTIVVSSPGGLLGGTYRGQFRDGALRVTGPLAPLCAEISYSHESNQLEFCGEEFERLQD